MDDSASASTATNEDIAPTQQTAIPASPVVLADEHDYSDAASVDSQHPRPQRRYQRGGRKEKQQSTRDTPACCGCEIHCKSIPEESDALQDEQLEEEEAEQAAEDYDQQELRNARSSRKASGERRKTAGRRDTGFGKFNVKRAEQSGGRPFGLSVERPESSNKAEKKAPKKTRPKAQSDENNGDEEEDGEEEEKRQPVAIRLDLNLELEIFLRAKVKGSIEITFL